MRHILLLASRSVLGGYLAVHGAQKLFGSFGGQGLDAAAVGFESMGLRPGKAAAAFAGASELGGGLMTATGIADPLGPLAIAGSMAVATTVLRTKGPLSRDGGFELPLTNLALALGLIIAGPGRFRLGSSLPRPWARLAALGALVISGLSMSQVVRASSAVPPTS
ncbi:MAG: DoxX family protein [Actinomycetota bacterium]|nr:MAG: DoxX family protein [Actinomycetota bacterium]